MRLLLLRLLFLLGGVAALTRPWTYDRCDSTAGPAAWPDSCRVRGLQSPVNLCGARGHAFAPIKLQGYDGPIEVAATNSSHTFAVRTGDQPASFTVGDLAAVIGHTNTSDVPHWQLAQLQLHTARVGITEEGSEHYLQGQAFPLEVQLLHFNYQYGTSLESAIRNSAGAADALLAVSILFRLGKKDVQFTKALVAALADGSAARGSPQVHLADVFDGDGPFYAYAGSLTTPPCRQPVTWLVMQRSKTVTLPTLTAIKSALLGPSCTRTGNVRPLQPIEGRVIYSSLGPTARCRPVEEPQVSCGQKEAVADNVVAPTAALQQSVAVQPEKPRSMPLPLSLAFLLVGMLLASFAVKATAGHHSSEDSATNGSTASGDHYGDRIAIPASKKPRPTTQYGPSYGTVPQR